MQICPSWKIKNNRAAESPEDLRQTLLFLQENPLYGVVQPKEAQAIALKIAVTDLSISGLSQEEVKSLLVFQKIHLSNKGWFSVLNSAMQSKEKEPIIECFLFLFNTFSKKDCLISEYIENVPSDDIRQFILAVIKLAEEHALVVKENIGLKIKLKTFNDDLKAATETLHVYIPLELEFDESPPPQSNFHKITSKLNRLTNFS